MKFLIVIWHSIAIFILLLVLSRILGKKLISQLTYYDFVVGIAIGTIASNYVVTIAKGPIILVSPAVLTLCALLMSYTMLRSWWFTKLIQGEPTVVIQNGEILEENLRKTRYTLDMLQSQAREQGAFNLGDVEFAVLEPHGQLSILLKSQKSPVTPSDLGIPTQYKGMASEVIREGDIVEQNLQQNRLSFGWLYDELRKRGIEHISQVNLALLQTDGSLYLDLKDDELEGYVQEIEDSVDSKRPLV